MINFNHDDKLRIASARLTAEQCQRAYVLGGPFTGSAIVEVEIDGQTVYGHLYGQVVNRGGLKLSTFVHPTYLDARRQRVADLRLGQHATAAEIDREIRDQDRAIDEAVRS